MSVCKCGHTQMMHDESGCRFSTTMSTEDSWDCSCTTYAPANPRPPLEPTCQYCGKPFDQHRKAMAHHEKAYCYPPDTRHWYVPADPPLEPTTQPVEGTRETTCETCGKEILYRPFKDGEEMRDYWIHKATFKRYCYEGVAHPAAPVEGTRETKWQVPIGVCRWCLRPEHPSGTMCPMHPDLAVPPDEPDDLPAAAPVEGPVSAPITPVLQELQERAEKYSEMERVARNNGDNCTMDHASGAKHAYFEAARLIRAALSPSHELGGQR